MRRAARAILLAMAVSGLMAATVQAAPAIPLNNGQETTDAKFGGSGSFEYWFDGDDFCYVLSWRNLTLAPWGAHVHGVAGRTDFAGVLIPLSVESSTTGSTSDCVAVDPALKAAILANPGNYYVNVHTDTFPGGEIRGQLK
jgi:hypothetical protein